MKNEINEMNRALAALCAEIMNGAQNLTWALKSRSQALTDAPIHKIDEPEEIAALEADYAAFVAALSEAREHLPRVSQERVVAALRDLTTAYAGEIDKNRQALMARQKRSREAIKLEREQYLALHE